MSNWQSRHDECDDLPYQEPEQLRLIKGQKVFYRGEIWVVDHAGHRKMYPQKYSNDSIAFYVLTRYEYGIIEMRYYVTNDDLGSGIVQDKPDFNKVEPCDTCLPGPQIDYSENYYALLGK